jgi:hypothetical protein
MSLSWPSRGWALAAVVLAVAVLSAEPRASELIARDATGVKLHVDAQARALVTFRSNGQTKLLLAWGAVDARPPSQTQAQVAFRLQFGGTVGPNACRAYKGPPLAWLVKACTAPDGTHWALQAWQRMLPNYGVAPSPKQAAWELRLSHWSGPLPVLEVWTDWSYRRFHHLYGRLTYRDGGVFGFEYTRSGVPLDTYGRNIFVDTLDSAYGGGWNRENSFITHRPTGGFCYGFYAHGSHPAGNGRKYRATVIGPGVTPDVMWQGPAPPPYDPAAETQANDAQRAVLGNDPLCKIN